MNDKRSTSWGNVASWYDDLLEDTDSYQSKVILPNLRRLLDIKKEDHVLDLACGQGFFARAWSECGARVVAADISRELIGIAQQKSERVDYHVASADKLSFQAAGSVDKGSMVLALQNIENYQGVISEIGRVLKPGGSFYLVLNHPVFRVPKESSWGWDEEKKVQYRRVDRYISDLKIPIEMQPGAAKSVQTLSFHRPLQSYFKAFQKAGLAVARLEEWVSHKKSDSGPRAPAENRARSEFPLFICLELVKRGT